MGDCRERSQEAFTRRFWRSCQVPRVASYSHRWPHPNPYFDAWCTPLPAPQLLQNHNTDLTNMDERLSLCWECRHNQ